MRFIDPVPRALSVPYSPFPWPARAIELLEIPSDTAHEDFFDVVGNRKTERILGKVDPSSISKLMWHIARGKSWADSSLGFPLSFRPTASAGSIHPIHVIILQPHDLYFRRYDSEYHAFVELDSSHLLVSTIRNKVANFLSCENAAIIFFIAEPGKTGAKYLHHESLVWRDAGILQGAFSLAATAMNLGFCPLGMTGDDLARSFDNENRLVGVGAAVLGAIAK